MTTLVAVPSPLRSEVPYRVRGLRTVAWPRPTHRGHWNPTEAGCMHSPQMGRWQR
jgi:hypothetical protein